MVVRRQDPVYVFRGGKKVQVGTFKVGKNHILAITMSDQTARQVMDIWPGELYWAPAQSKKDQMCAGCMLGFCGDEPKEGFCGCCTHDHHLSYKERQ